MSCFSLRCCCLRKANGQEKEEKAQRPNTKKHMVSQQVEQTEQDAVQQ